MPFCHQNPTASTSNNALVQQLIASASTQAQYTPIPPGTVTTLRQTIGTGNALKSKSSGATQPLPPALDVNVRVAHAKYSGTHRTSGPWPLDSVDQRYSPPPGVPQRRRRRLRKLSRRLLHRSKQRQTARQRLPTSVRSHRQ